MLLKPSETSQFSEVDVNAKQEYTFSKEQSKVKYEEDKVQEATNISKIKSKEESKD